MIRFLIFLSLFLPMVTVAATDTFRVGTFVGTDTTPPSTPIIISATAVSQNQINVVWSVSTDNTIVAGYRLYRDGLPIATTSQTTFSDTGLTASTTYTYTVDAYDIFGNISSASLPEATTTLPLPTNLPPVATTTTEIGTSQSTAPPRLVGMVTVISERTTATLSWQTNMYSKFYLRWGRTDNYELGLIAGGVLKTRHETVLYNLEPGSRYYYEVIGETAHGFTATIGRGSFETKPPESASIAPNVFGVKAYADGNDTVLSWQNPPSEFSYIRILRSHLFYPLHPSDGQVVYQGTGAAFKDEGALASFSPQYYSIFVFDTEGNVSSGAIARVFKDGAVSSLPGNVPLPGGVRPTTTGTSTKEGIEDTSIPIGDSNVLSAEEVYLEQGTTLVTFVEAIELEAEAPFLVWIPKSAVPPHLKSIIFTLHDVSNNTEATHFLMKLSPDESRYQAMLPAVMRGGTARGMVEVYDYETGLVRRITVPFTFTSAGNTWVIWPDMFVRYWFVTALGLSVMGFLWWLLLYFRRRYFMDNKAR